MEDWEPWESNLSAGEDWEQRAKTAEALLEKVRDEFRQVMELNLKLLEINDKLQELVGFK